ncbi:MAG: hypothetical protein M1826_005428 [Phylliscum demangeonii]|nr:MAG: hypothetical protein M1826_005428 [Phylliscum demangeonii]
MAPCENHQYAVIIISIEELGLPYIGTLMTQRDAPNSLRLKLVVDTKTDYRSYLRLLGTIRRYPALTDDNPDNETSFSLRLGLQALTLLQFHGATNETPILAIAQHQLLVAQAAPGECMTGTATVKGSEIIGTGLLNQRTLSVEATRQIDAIKVFLTQRKPRQITFLFRNREALSQDFAQLADCLDVESRADPLAPWHATHPSRVYVQYNQVPRPEDRPAPRYTSQLAFTNFGEYVTVLGFAAIQEHEAEEKAQSSLRDVTFGARFITISGAAKRRYFGFLNLQMLQGRVTTGDSMKISFGIARDPEELEWSAYITESLPVTPNGATTMILCRPRVTDDQGVYIYRNDGTALRAVRSHFQQDRDLAAAILASQPHAINLRWTVTSLAVRRQIVALAALQDGRSELHQGYRELLIGRHLSLQTTKDLYERINDPGLPAYLQSLPLSASQQSGLAYFRAIPHGKRARRT